MRRKRRKKKCLLRKAGEEEGVVADAGTAMPQRKLKLGDSSDSSEHSFVVKPRVKPLPES